MPGGGAADGLRAVSRPDAALSNSLSLDLPLRGRDVSRDFDSDLLCPVPCPDADFNLPAVAIWLVQSSIAANSSVAKADAGVALIQDGALIIEYSHDLLQVEIRYAKF